MVSISPMGALGSVMDFFSLLEITFDFKESLNVLNEFRVSCIIELLGRVSKVFNIVVSLDNFVSFKTLCIKVSLGTTVCAVKVAQVDKVKINPINRLIKYFKFETSFVLRKILQFRDLIILESRVLLKKPLT